MIIDTLYGPAMFVLGGLSALVGVGLYALTVVPRPRLNGFDVEDQEGRRMHDYMAGRR